MIVLLHMKANWFYVSQRFFQNQYTCCRDHNEMLINQLCAYMRLFIELILSSLCDTHCWFFIEIVLGMLQGDMLRDMARPFHSLLAQPKQQACHYGYAGGLSVACKNQWKSPMSWDATMHCSTRQSHPIFRPTNHIRVMPGVYVSYPTDSLTAAGHGTVKQFMAQVCPGEGAISRGLLG